MKDNIIKDFDHFKKVNESDMTLFGLISGMAGDQIAKSAKERATAMVLEYFGVPPIDPNNPETKSLWISELFIKLMGEVSLKDMDDFLLGRRSINDQKYWTEKFAKALKYQIVQIGPRPADVINLLGVTPSGFLGRLITNMYTEYILDEKRLEQLIIAVWRLVAKEDFIPQKKAGEIYDEAYDKLSQEQKDRVEGSVWKASMQQKDFARTKGD
jgi:hypothetical protein